jgi:DNA-binding transcriptional LysR family regulator
MDQSAEMRAFVRAIDRGAFAGAAKDLKLTPSAISKVVTRLERRLGVRLVNRTTRRLALTAEGETYYQAARNILAAIEQLESNVTASADRPRGLLRVNTSLSFALHYLSPAIVDFQARYPEVRVHLSVNDRLVDLLAENIDVALRLGPQADSSLMTRKVAVIERVLCASPAYLEKFGTPRSPAELARHRCIVFSVPGRDQWPFRTASGEIEHVQVDGALASDSPACLLRFALAGAGIARLGDFMTSEPIQQGLLVPLLTDQHHPEPTAGWAVFPPGTQKTPKLRAFLDFLVEHFSAAPWRR